MTEFTKDDIENIKQELNMFPQDDSVTVSKSMILFLVNEIERLQDLISAYENDLVLVDVTEMLKKAKIRIQELEEEKQAVWKEWLEKIEKRWDEEDKQERQWIDEGKTLIVKKDGDSWFAIRPDFKNLQQSESRWFSGDINEYMDAVYWYLNDDKPQLPQEEE